MLTTRHPVAFVYTLAELEALFAYARAIDWSSYHPLKTQGLSDREIARQWDIPWTTFHREKGKRQGLPSTVHPATVDRPPSTIHLLQTDLTAALTAALQPVLARLDALETGLARQGDRPPSTWELKPLKHSVRWTIYVPQALQEEIKRRAAARGQDPSLLVQEALARWLTEEV
jgi:hypothetical protein